MRIEDVEIFAVGTWNGIEFGSVDLDAIVRSFDELELAGKLPVKLGHDMRDTQPAQGWITALRREGDKLLATLDQVPDDLVAEIKEGRWRHVSVELLGNVSKGAKKHRWVLDALAVLGAARPAVDVLQGLHELVARSLPGWAFSSRMAFSRNLEGSSMSDSIASLKSQLVDELFNSAISTGRIIPACRERFYRRYGQDVSKFSVDDVKSWIATEPQPTQMSRGGDRLTTRAQPNGSDASGETPDDQVITLARQKQDEHRVKFGRTPHFAELSFYDATLAVMRDPAHKGVVRAYLDREHLR
jgi:hypothetical protein